MLSNCGAGKMRESFLDFKEIKPVNTKRNQPWIFIGRTDAETEAPILWQPDAWSWLIGKDPDNVKDWRQEEKEVTEDDMVEWHHRLSGWEFEQTPGRTGKPGVLQSMGSQRVKHDWVTEQQKILRHWDMKKKDTKMWVVFYGSRANTILLQISTLLRI